MDNDDTKGDQLLDPQITSYLQEQLHATDDELRSLQRLVQLQQEAMARPRENRNQPSVVLDDFLFHGDLGHAIDMELLLDLGITHIINLCDCPLDPEIIQILDVVWINDFEDSLHSDLRQHLDRINTLLCEYKEKGEKVLVHCQAGISRSSSIILAYLIKYHHDSVEKAYQYLLERRPIAAPNYNFLIQLIRYEKEVKGGNDGDQHNPIQTVQN